MNLVSLLVERAAAHPDRPAIIEGDGTGGRAVTFAELDRRVGGAAQSWSGLGLRPGARILIAHPVSIRLYEVLLGAFSAGLVPVVPDPSAGIGFLRQCCAAVRPDIFFGSPAAHLLRAVVPALRRCRGVHTGRGVPFSTRWRPAREAGAVPIDVPDDHPALITFTSGSTGAPKAAVRTHGFLLAQHRALAAALDHREGEVDLITLPVFLLANLASGLTSVIADSPLARPAEPDMAKLARQFETTKPSRGAASPAFFDALASRDSTLLSGFARVYTGGAPVFPKLMDKLSAAAPAARLFTVYGSTEAEPIAHIEWSEAVREDRDRMRAGGGLLVGPPVPGLQLAILPDCWGTSLPAMTPRDFQPLPAGAPGEIVVSGDHVLRGYLDPEHDRETKFSVGDQVWHRTGDAGWLDDRGRLWLLGRCAAGVGAGSHRTYSFAVEVAAGELPGVRRAAFAAFDGKKILALEGEPEAKPLESFLRQLPAGLVDETRRLDRIPVDRRHQAKVDYPALRRMLVASASHR